MPRKSPRGERASQSQRAKRAVRTVPSAWALLLILVAAVWARAGFLRYPFFADDFLFLDQMRGGSIANAWTVRDPLSNYWRPLSRQLYFWAVTVLGGSPVVAHALNLALFVGLLVLLYLLGRRLGSPRVGLAAAALVALHAVADVPLLWASGSQDLLAVTGALGALCLTAHGRVGWAALPLLAGLLSKETVVVTPVIAVWMVKQSGATWLAAIRRTTPLWAATFVWLPVWAWRMSGGVRDGLQFDASSLPAALVHLPQVFLGIEWAPGARPGFPASLSVWLPLMVLGAGVLLSRVGGIGSKERSEGRGHALAVGLVWALVASVPVSLVVHIWSSYYYLFAVCGLALAVAAFTERLPAPAALAVVLAVALGSQGARGMESFASRPDPWGAQSHLTRFYFDRSMRWISRYLEDLRRQRPTLPPRSTLFFAGIPAFASWQAGNGALVRWAYRDGTLSSYFFADFTLERARRGPLFFFTARGDSLVETTDRGEGLLALAAGQMLSEHHRTALDAVNLALESAPTQQSLLYWRAWLGLAVGDSSRLAAELRVASCEPRPGPSPAVARAQRLVASGDVPGAVQALAEGIRQDALDPALHGLLAELLAQAAPGSAGGAMEALVARLLAPQDARAWRRWALAQVAGDHLVEAHASLSRYFDLAGDSARADAAAVRLLETLREGLPGGRLAQEALRRRPDAR